jgi:hypothetical protein
MPVSGVTQEANKSRKLVRLPENMDFNIEHTKINRATPKRARPIFLNHRFQETYYFSSVSSEDEDEDEDEVVPPMPEIAAVAPALRANIKDAAGAA